jgi:hypothetical protein
LLLIAAHQAPSILAGRKIKRHTANIKFLRRWEPKNPLSRGGKGRPEEPWKLLGGKNIMQTASSSGRSSFCPAIYAAAGEKQAAPLAACLAVNCVVAPADEN